MHHLMLHLFSQWRPMNISCAHNNPYRQAAVYPPPFLSNKGVASYQYTHLCWSNCCLNYARKQHKKASKQISRWLTRDQHSWLGKREPFSLLSKHNTLYLIYGHRAWRSCLSIVLCSLWMSIYLSLCIKSIFWKLRLRTTSSYCVPLTIWIWICLV